jgi:hypothetical protein
MAADDADNDDATEESDTPVLWQLIARVMRWASLVYAVPSLLVVALLVALWTLPALLILTVLITLQLPLLLACRRLTKRTEARASLSELPLYRDPTDWLRPEAGGAMNGPSTSSWARLEAAQRGGRRGWLDRLWQRGPHAGR